MILLEKKETVATFWIKESKVIILKKGVIIINEKILIKNDKINWTSYINFCCNYIFIQQTKFDEVFCYNYNGKLINQIDKGYNIDFKNINDINYFSNRNTKSFWIIDDKFILTNTNKYVQFNTVLNNNIIHNTSTFINCYKNLDGELKWNIRIEDYGRDIAKDPETGVVLWDNPNEIKEDLFADNRNIYVPLKGGQLLALNSQTGEKVWMFDNEKYGIYNIFKNKIYKGDGKSIIVINAINGQAEKELHFKNIPVLKGYIPAGPFLIYDDIIISTDVLYGKICLLKRSTLEVEEFFSLDTKIVNSKNAIIWNDNKLYVLDIEQTLHIFEKESTPTL